MNRKPREIKWKYKIGENITDEKRNICIIDKEIRLRITKEGWNNNRKWYKYKCNKCGFEDWTREEYIKRGNRCNACNNIERKGAKLGINTIWDTDRWMCDLGVSEEDAKTHTSQSKDKVKVTCPDCKKTKTKDLGSIYRTNSIGCTCSDKVSYPNKFSYSLLDQLNKIYGFKYLEREYSPEWIGRRKYDNYFIYNEKEYILEMDGSFHYCDNRISGQTMEESKAIDNEKDLKAKEYGIEVVRINCEKSELDFIKQNIIDSRLNEIFDLSKIDWINCEKSALSNLVKVACNYKKNNPNMTTGEIGVMMKLSYNTIRSYLKKGEKLNWCSYNPKDEIKKLCSKNGVNSGKEVEIFKDGISLGIYPSCAELSRKSEELFGIKLLAKSIASVCRNKNKINKGYTFKYINKKGA